MLTINLKERFRNKTFLLSMIGAIVLLAQQLGSKDLIPSNYADVVNSILTILIMLGIVVDPSTKGISDKVVSNATVQAINKQEETKAEASTISVNNEVTENSQGITIDKTGMSTSGALAIKDNSIDASVQEINLNASAKIEVVNPENVVSDGNVVNAISASAPTV